MLFERIEVPGLSHYSYIVGCPADGRIAVIDPKRDIDTYIEFARSRGLRISHVLETHIHADFASGAYELSKRTGAEVLVSRHDAGETFEVQFQHTDIDEGDAIELGSVRIQALHTPGHTPEHMSFLVYDLKRSADTPLAILTGDFLFVGSLGRPDLLGEEAKKQLAHQLFHSVREKLRDLPDGLEVHPGHGAGSLCGSGMSTRPMSTLGFERLTNPYLDPSLSEDEFVHKILSTVPPFPDYYRRMKRINSDGPAILKDIPGQKPLAVDQFAELVNADHIVIDLRDQFSFAGGHIHGAFGIDTGPSLAVWASYVVPYDKPILLVTRDPNEAEEAGRGLIRVGLDNVVGYLEGGMEVWQKAGLPVEQIGVIQPTDLHEKLQRREQINVLDVRTDDEWQGGHIHGAMHVFGGEIEKEIEQLPDRDEPIAVVCGSGYRSTVIASVLRRRGFSNITNIAGGMNAWQRAGLPLEQDAATTDKDDASTRKELVS